MKNKKIIVVIAIAIALLIITGCKNNKIKVSGERINTNNMGHKHCTRNAQAGEGITTNLSYDIYYSNDKLNVLESTEEIQTSDSSVLDEYEEAYKNINKNYDGLLYYDTQVERTEKSVLRHTIINYEKIDIDALLNIEGKDDNIIENGQAKLKLWLDLAEKFGAKCEEVEE